MPLKRVLRRAAAALLLASVGAGPDMAAAQAVPVDEGRLLLQAQGDRLLMQDSHGQPLRDWPLHDAQRQAGTVLAIFDAPQRRSAIVALQGLAELWEISIDPAAEPIFDGWVHDYRMGEGLARPGYLGIRRTRLARPLVAVFFDPRVPWLVGAEIGEPAGTPPMRPLTAVVINLDIRRAVARIALPDQPLPAPLQPAPLQPAPLQPGPVPPPLDGTRLWREDGRWLLRLPATAGWVVYDTQRWVLLRHEPR